MRLHEIIYNEAVPIDSYGPGFFRVSGQVMRGNLVILPGGVSLWDGYSDTQALLGAADDIDVLFVGTGSEITQVPAAFRKCLEDADIGVELMATPPACRTYNILLSEGRRVGVALIAP